MQVLASGATPEHLQVSLQKLGHYLEAYEDLITTLNSNDKAE